MRRNFTRIPRMTGSGRATPGRASAMRSYLGGADQFGALQGRPSGSVVSNVDAAMAMGPAGPGGAVSTGTQYDQLKQMSKTGTMPDTEQNQPEGGGGQMGAGYVAPIIDPYALLTGLSPSQQFQLNNLRGTSELYKGSATMVDSALKILGGGYTWDAAKGQFVPVQQAPAPTTTTQTTTTGGGFRRA